MGRTPNCRNPAIPYRTLTIAEQAHHELLHHISNLSDAIIHVDPAGGGIDPHATTAHHTHAEGG